MCQTWFQHAIKEVVAGGPADKIGIENGMLLISLNGINVIGFSHAEVLSEMKKNKHHVVLTVIQEEVRRSSKTKRVPKSKNTSP